METRLKLGAVPVLVIGGVEKRITPNMANILWHLMVHRLSRIDDLIEYLWPDPDHSPDTPDRNIRVHICNLRRALRGSGWTIPRCCRGYTLEKVESGYA